MGSGNLIFFQVFISLISPHCLSLVKCEEKLASEGESVTLKCRFSPIMNEEKSSSFWLRTNKEKHDSVAMKGSPLENNYRVDYRPEEGVYDLTIDNTNYERDNGMFECRVKLVGSGKELHYQTYTFTVLTLPKPPRIIPGPNITIMEGKQMELSCSTTGGNPAPHVKWYRDGSSHALNAMIVKASDRDEVTKASLVLSPGKDEDGAVYRCVVWNRAMPDGTRLESTVKLNVNYYPRVEVGPENPLRVELDKTAKLQCRVDAKPKVTSVRWTRNGQFIATTFNYTILRVNIPDGGTYACSADNGLGKVGQAELFLDVLYPPEVSAYTEASGVIRASELDEGESLTVTCNVTSNPPPYKVDWLKENDPSFRHPGNVLRLSSVTAANEGNYVCRAINILMPYGTSKTRSERVANTTVAVRVRHRPGQSRISPEKPIGEFGGRIVLTCTAEPRGWPPAQFRWWKDLDKDHPVYSANTVLATGADYVIINANQTCEGSYHCLASNEMGQGIPDVVDLEVYEPPMMIANLQSRVTRKAGDTDYSVTCSVQGKPKPTAKWLKEGELVTSDNDDYEIITSESEVVNALYIVQSTLRFNGRHRPNGNQVVPADRGLYSCVFENEVGKNQTTMILRIEHEPIILHEHNKVAYDEYETAEIVCRVQAFPRPEFKWLVLGKPLPLSSTTGMDRHYDYSMISEDNDAYISILRINSVQTSDYGVYTCQVSNDLGSIQSDIKLNPIGPPDHPTGLKAIRIGFDFMTLYWKPGYNGGIQNTKYLVAYKSVMNYSSENCPPPINSYQKSRRRGDGWQEFDCQSLNPCNITVLQQQHSYRFRVKAYNTKGHSDYSEVLTASTRVSKMPQIEKLTYDPGTHILSISVEPTCLLLMGQVERSQVNSSDWKYLETIPIAFSNGYPIRSEGLLTTVGRTHSKSELETNAQNTRLRVRLCLKASPEVCGDYREAEFESATLDGVLGEWTWIIIVVICVIFVLLIGLLVMFCRSRGPSKRTDDETDDPERHYEIETKSRRSVAQQSPVYCDTGLENRALERSVDLARDDSPKSPIFPSQTVTVYHHPPQSPHAVPDWDATEYNEISYSNSNNGGSVNSQDSLWQMKLAAANNAINDQHTQNNYGYDPLTHGGYGTVDDYAAYPHIISDTPDHDYGSRTSNNPSRNEYLSDPYGPVYKQKKLLNPHLEPRYRDVSGLPDPYMETMDMEESKPHMFDESLGSGYSTPNSRGKRVVREIVV